MRKPIVETDLLMGVQVNSLYAAVQWPIRHCCVSGDGTLLAIAGRNGLVHWSANTGRWKMFTSEAEEASFSVRGGMVWYHHVLVVASESARGTEVSRWGYVLADALNKASFIPSVTTILA